MGFLKTIVVASVVVLIMATFLAVVMGSLSDTLSERADEIEQSSAEYDDSLTSNYEPEYDSALVRNYEIVEIEDDLWKSAIRKQYRVLVPTDISKEELKATLIQIVLDKTSENKDIDAISIFAYDRREDVNGAYTLGTVDWCPNGNWGDVTPEIASSNDRSSYEYVFDIKEKVGDDNLERPTDLEFEIRDYYTVCSDAEWDKIDLSDPYAVVDEEVIYQKVADKYGITKEEAKEICMKVTLYQMQ
ncbi:MAG: hypothetical protein K8R11_11070 [Methanococcoides sp.]|nr:hypothetical protein [Methanococcoides sp.]